MTRDAAPTLLPSPRALRPFGSHITAPAGLLAEVEAAVLEPDPGRDSASGFILKQGDAGPGIDAYTLVIEPATDKPVITGATPAARRAGLHTLRQLARLTPGRLPAVDISDHATFAIRGVMLDVSRTRVPTMDHLRAAVDLLASLKFNHLQLYTEHTFAYAGHEAVWHDASPISPDEARALDDYCSARGVQLSANQNCFGHLARWLRLPEYRALAEIERDDQEWRFMHFARRGPFSLCPVEPACPPFVADLLSQLVPCFRSGLVNIGCDETFDVGWGRSAGAAARLVETGEAHNADDARAHLFFAFVNDINAALKRTRTRAGQTPRPMMWADIALHHPRLLNRLPEDAIGLTWEYEPTEKFASWVRSLVDRGREAWVCPGTSSWRSFTGRTRERRANIADAAEQGAAHGATGLLVCDWGDVGHRQQWSISLPAIAQAAEAAWNPASARAFDTRAASWHAMQDPTMTLAPWLEQLGDIDAEVRAAAKLRNATALFADLHAPLDTPPNQRPVPADLPLWHDARDRFRALVAATPRMDDPLVRAEVQLTLLRTGLAIDHAIVARTTPIAAADRDRLSSLCHAVITEHRRLWAFRSRPGGLAESVHHDLAILAAINPARGVPA